MRKKDFPLFVISCFFLGGVTQALFGLFGLYMIVLTGLVVEALQYYNIIDWGKYLKK